MCGAAQTPAEAAAVLTASCALPSLFGTPLAAAEAGTGAAVPSPPSAAAVDAATSALADGPIGVKPLLLLAERAAAAAAEGGEPGGAGDDASDASWLAAFREYADDRSAALRGVAAQCQLPPY